jgi:F-type H+-transporting ATPase subunit gamma
MPALIDIRRRIRSVRSTEQITKAMKMVSAAKLRRAQEAMFGARPYAHRMEQVLASLAARSDPEGHPLLRVRGGGKALLIVVTADKGLCGGFNSNIVRAAQRFLEKRPKDDTRLILVGRKGRDALRRQPYAIQSEHIGVFHRLRYESARDVAREATESFTSASCDEVHLVYNEFKSVIQQRIIVKRLLPIPRLKVASEETLCDYLFEPDPVTIFDRLLPKHVEVQMWHAFLESAAAEHGARMAAMDAATNNAAEMIERLTLHMNKVRQAAITNEIIEVVSGAGAPA